MMFQASKPIYLINQHTKIVDKDSASFVNGLWIVDGLILAILIDEIIES